MTEFLEFGHLHFEQKNPLSERCNLFLGIQIAPGGSPNSRRPLDPRWPRSIRRWPGISFFALMPIPFPTSCTSTDDRRPPLHVPILIRPFLQGVPTQSTRRQNRGLRWGRGLCGSNPSIRRHDAESYYSEGG